ncbi:hypothetical protein C8R45DRAFT_1014704 [Mycena sanguinolenta]|nr:hypothetical protein C8R45DRAFT_1014704 [Mycena sanguinolenta]
MDRRRQHHSLQPQQIDEAMIAKFKLGLLVCLSGAASGILGVRADCLKTLHVRAHGFLPWYALCWLHAVLTLSEMRSHVMDIFVGI